MLEQEEIQAQNVVQSNKIKLSVSTKGIYTWEISILSHDIDELKRLNDKMNLVFNAQINTSFFRKEKDD